VKSFQATTFTPDILKIDPAAEAERISSAIRKQVFGNLRRRGAVLGLSGGIDSSVTAALCVRALGRERVLGLFLPESESSADSLRLGKLLGDFLGIDTALEDIGPILEAAGCYRRRDEAIRSVIPGYGDGYKSKLVIPGLLSSRGYTLFSVVVESPDGKQTHARLTAEAYLAIVAATSFKQRTRKMMEYFHADRLQYAVAGTPNRLEHDQGFFVKNGDGAADLKPIAHLYKTQVFQLATFLQIPEEIRARVPTTDTYSLEQTQEEFFFALPYDKLDLCLYALNHNISADEVAPACGLTPDQVRRVQAGIVSKRKATRHLHMESLLVEAIPEVSLAGEETAQRSPGGSAP
jgi:NAD+ synthase